MFGYGKRNQAKKPMLNNSETGLLYYRVGKDGVMTNFQAWLRGWKEHKITEYDVSFQEGLREYKREAYDLNQALNHLEYQPLVTISKDFWVPSARQLAELEGENNTVRRGYVERRMMAEWAEKQALRNAEIQAQNDAIKKQRDEIIAKGNETARKNTITQLMGKIMGDMTAESRRMVMKWRRTEAKDPNDPMSALMADTIDEAYQIYDWLFVFEAAMVTHLHADCTVDATAVLERQEKVINKLKSMKHDAGSLQSWLQRFDDAIEECETMGANVTDEMKRTYLMHNLNEKIFEQTLLLWRGVLTRSNFPQTYDALKAYVTNEYSSQMTQNERAKVIYNVISTPKKKTELSMQTGETQKPENDKNKCHVCGRLGHKKKQCWYYDATKSLEENKKQAQEKLKAKAEAKKKKRAEIEKQEEDKKEVPNPKQDHNKGVPHKGTYAQLPPKLEQAGMCLVQDALLYCEPCNMAGVRPGQIDFIYDSGTVSGVIGEKEMSILKNVAEEDVLIETVTGEKSISKLYGDTIFGKTRILNGRRGSVLVSQYATKKMYQVLNPNEDTFILRGWEHNPVTRGKVWYFTRDEERYKDKLLHCTVDLQEAKCFGVTKESKFYDPVQMPTQVRNDELYQRINTIHSRFQHASANELKNMLRLNIREFEGLRCEDIDSWYNDQGHFCSGCAEGKLKEHARVRSTKPLQAEVPGEITVGDIMFVEMKQTMKKPLLIHVDVKTKMITGVPLSNRSEEECTKALVDINNYYKNNNRPMKQLVFDREPGVIPVEGVLRSSGVELMLKAAGQKVGLAEVTIRLIREKARATKAGVRQKYGYLPPNQFNMDLCLDSISVLNRIPKRNEVKNPYEMFMGRKNDFMRDFRVDWGEPVVVKKPKGLVSDLTVTGQWAVIVRRIMNGSGVLKVYLIQSKRYAYRLRFVRAIAPEWVLEALKEINTEDAIGFEAENEEEENKQILDLINEDDRLEERQTDRAVVNLDEDEEDEVRFIGDQQQETMVTRSIKSIEDAWNNSLVKKEKESEHETMAKQEENLAEEGRSQPEEFYRTRSGRVSRPPQRLIETAYAVVNETYRQNFCHDDDDVTRLTIECTYMMKALLFQKAMKYRPDEAMKALREEVTKAVKIDVWDPVHLQDMSQEEQELIIPQMMNYLEKYKPDMSFEKCKVRVLTRGDQQKYTGESEGPVARIETLLLLLSVAIHQDLEVFKVDIGSAFMRTPMVEDVKHKWVKLDKRVVQVLIELEPERYKNYVLPDGTIIVKMKKLSYGYVEAAHYWWKDLSETFTLNGYITSRKDKCMFMKREMGNLAFCATTVDDCLFVTTKNNKWVQQQIKVLQDKYEEVTIETGDELGLIGMQIRMDRKEKKVILTQPKHVAKVIEKFGVNKGAPNPAMVTLMGDDDESPKLKDQADYMSKCASIMFLSQRTYPEIRPAAVKLSTKYNKATDLDMEKAKRVVEYIYGCKDTHCLVLAPKTLELVSAADASYAEHSDGRSHSGGVVGFRSETSCFFGFVSSKQPVVAKSAGEAELIAQNKVGDLVEWARDILEELGYTQMKVPMYVDSTCAMQMVKQGTGSFKRAKHIKVRFFWLKDLIDLGLLELVYMPTDELVADILTKPLVGWKFQYLLFKLLGWNDSKMNNKVHLTEEVC